MFYILFVGVWLDAVHFWFKNGNYLFLLVHLIEINFECSVSQVKISFLKM